MEGPFDSLESAHEYVTLLTEQVIEVRLSVGEDVAEAMSEGGGRRLDALRLVEFKLNQLEQHLSASRRTLRDLRVLSRLLLRERDGAAAEDSSRGAAELELV